MAALPERMDVPDGMSAGEYVIAGPASVTVGLATLL
jgi:hypothetical protein